MLRRAFLRRMALAAAACAFIDVPWPKVVESVTDAAPGGLYLGSGDELSYAFPSGPQEMTVYVKWRERGEIESRERCYSFTGTVEELPGRPVADWTGGDPDILSVLKVARGTRTMAEMRALART